MGLFGALVGVSTHTVWGVANAVWAVGKQAVGKQAVGKQAVGKQAVGKQKARSA